jgi:hypothetical protein
MSNTPEIDEVEKYSGVTIKDSVTTCGDESSSVYIPVIFARQLERERDQLKQLLAADSERVDAYLGVCIERDEAQAMVEKLMELGFEVMDRNRMLKREIKKLKKKYE